MSELYRKRSVKSSPLQTSANYTTIFTFCELAWPDESKQLKIMMIGQLRAEIYEKQVSGWNVQILIRNHSPTTNSNKHLPSQKSLRFWWLVRLRSVRTRNVLFVEFPGIEFSFPFFLSALPQAHSPTTHHQIRYQWLEPRSVYSISYYYLAFVSHFRFCPHYVANRSQIDWRWASFHATSTLPSHLTNLVFFLFSIQVKHLVNNSQPRLLGRPPRYAC